MPSETDLTGEWIVTLTDIFSSNCLLLIEHSGVGLSATQTCDDETGTIGSGTFEGTFDATTVEVLLAGPFTLITTLSLVGTVSKDGTSIAGDWTVEPGGLTGSFTATRMGEPTPIGPTTTAEVATATAGPDATPVAEPTTMPPELPQTGSGTTPSSGNRAAWALAVLGAASILGGLTSYAARRLPRPD